MVIDTSALLEARIVVERQPGPAGQAELDLLLSRAVITAVPLEELHVHWALQGSTWATASATAWLGP